ncbi:MAG TPA: DUF4139 domain-containing protein [Methanosarcina sp.]|nr:DUF4139 domain-containing protein [Methanosarcina sp.]
MKEQTIGQTFNTLDKELAEDTEKVALIRDAEITVYNDNLALIKEKRKLNLKVGVQSVEYINVTSQIDPTSVLVEDPINKKTAVLEQQYVYDLVSSSNLLDRYVGKEIKVTDIEGKIDTGKLLSHDEKGVVLERNDGSVVALQTSKVDFSNASGLLTKPTLVWQIYSPTAGERDLLISYLTGGLSWKANYIVKTNANYTEADVKSWVSMDNKTGTNFENAKLKLVAGNINRILTSQPRNLEYKATFAAPKSGFEGGTLFEYHLYTLEKPANLKNNQIKQLSLLSADSMPVSKELVFDGQIDDKIRTIIHIDNSEVKGLGIPLPKGVIGVYGADSEGQLQFLGEDQIDHTPKDKEIKLTVGYSFDVTGKRIQTSYERITSDLERTSYSIELNNSKSEAQDVTVVEHLNGDWQILNSSDKYEKIDAFTIEFRVSVPANDKKTVSYTVENKSFRK